MKFLTTLVAVTNTDPPQVMAISPTDDVWFVKAEDIPPGYASEVERLLKGQGLEVLGVVLIGDNWERKP